MTAAKIQMSQLEEKLVTAEIALRHYFSPFIHTHSFTVALFVRYDLEKIKEDYNTSIIIINLMIDLTMILIKYLLVYYSLLTVFCSPR